LRPTSESSKQLFGLDDSNHGRVAATNDSSTSISTTTATAAATTTTATAATTTTTAAATTTTTAAATTTTKTTTTAEIATATATTPSTATTAAATPTTTTAAATTPRAAATTPTAAAAAVVPHDADGCTTTATAARGLCHDDGCRRSRSHIARPVHRRSHRRRRDRGDVALGVIDHGAVIATTVTTIAIADRATQRSGSLEPATAETVKNDTQVDGDNRQERGAVQPIQFGYTVRQQSLNLNVNDRSI